jgi:hypothetical protein
MSLKENESHLGAKRLRGKKVIVGILNYLLVE